LAPIFIVLDSVLLLVDRESDQNLGPFFRAKFPPTFFWRDVGLDTERRKFVKFGPEKELKFCSGSLLATHLPSEHGISYYLVAWNYKYRHQATV
jgi:hypothetical protein